MHLIQFLFPHRATHTHWLVNELKLTAHVFPVWILETLILSSLWADGVINFYGLITEVKWVCNSFIGLLSRSVLQHIINVQREERCALTHSTVQYLHFAFLLSITDHVKPPGLALHKLFHIYLFNKCSRDTAVFVT